MQSNELYGTTKWQGSDSNYQLRESREVPTKLTEQPQSDEWFELKRNEAYVTSMTLQIPTVDNVAYNRIQVV